MNQNKFGELVFNDNDLIDLLMRGHDISKIRNLTVSSDVDLEKLITIVENPDALITWTFPYNSDKSVPDYDKLKQQQWLMPDEYKDFDIAGHVLSLCKDETELQRVGEELLLYQERDMFNLLKYMHYLVSVMRENHVIWGVGRGSSVASFVLYLLGVHKINSIYYNLSIKEFLR